MTDQNPIAAEPDESAAHKTELPIEREISKPPEPARWMLPHTPTCLVCGPHNPHGLKLDLYIFPDSGHVEADFLPRPHHVGFEGVIHGGLLSTLMDEAMTWASTWNQKRFCMCGELNVRFRQSVIVGQKIRIEALVDFSRPKLIDASAKIFDEYHKLLSTATGKYVPLPPDQHERFVRTIIDDPRSKLAAEKLGRVSNIHSE